MISILEFAWEHAAAGDKKPGKLVSEETKMRRHTYVLDFLVKHLEEVLLAGRDFPETVLEKCGGEKSRNFELTFGPEADLRRVSLVWFSVGRNLLIFHPAQTHSLCSPLLLIPPSLPSLEKQPCFG